MKFYRNGYALLLIGVAVNYAFVNDSAVFAHTQKSVDAMYMFVAVYLNRDMGFLSDRKMVIL